MRVMLHMFARQIEPDIKKADDLYQTWIKKTVETQRKFYGQALEDVGIPPSEE